MSSLAGSGCGLGFGRRVAFSPLSFGPSLWLRGDAGITLAADPAIGAWTLAAGWTSMGGGVYAHAGAADNLSQANLTVGQTFRIQYAVSGVAGGTIQPYAGATAGTARNANGSYSEILTCTTNTTLAFVGTGTASVGSIAVTNLSITAQADQSGNAKHAVQATATKQPYLDDPARGGTGRNGKAVVRFFGGQCLQTPAIDLSGTQKATVVIVFSDAPAALGMIYESGAAFGVNKGLDFYSDAALLHMRMNNASGTSYCTTPHVPGWQLGTVLHDSAEVLLVNQNKYRRNTAATVMTGSAGPIAAGALGGSEVLNIGARNNAASLGWIGSDAELLLFPRLLSVAELALLESYLMTAWGLP